MLGLMVHVGPQALRFSTVARRAQVSRPWLYKYFGSDVDALRDYAIKTWGEHFAELSRSRGATSVTEWRAAIESGTRRGFEHTLAKPEILQGFSRYVTAVGPIADGVREIEERHVAHFVEEMPTSLKKDVAAARRFARRFTAARMGAYYRWTEPAWRSKVAEDELMRDLMRVVDAWIEGR